MIRQYRERVHKQVEYSLHWKFYLQWGSILVTKEAGTFFYFCFLNFSGGGANAHRIVLGHKVQIVLCKFLGLYLLRQLLETFLYFRP